MTGFDPVHPPARELLDDCVHCGFCLPTCPTYQLWGEEMDSPRGRIYLMDLAERGEIGLEGPFTEHLDACLGCMACVTACPSGVRYDQLLEATRPQIERNVRRGRADRWFRNAIFSLFPYRRRLRAAAVFGVAYQKSGLPKLLGKVLPARLAAAQGLLPPVRLRDAFAPLPRVVPAQGTKRRRVAMLSGCVQDVFFHQANLATLRVLAAEGCEVLVPRDQGCCGALGLHAGREEHAVTKAKRTIETFGGLDVDAVVVNVAGCGSSMKEYAHLLADDPQWSDRAKAFSAEVQDITEFLAGLEPVARRHPIEAKAAYHDACHLGHAQGIRNEPRTLLRTIPGLEVTDLPDAEICCGSAGIYNLVQPDAAAELGRRKADNIRAVGPDLLVTANPGCLLQIGKQLDGELPMMHPVQLLDLAIRGLGLGG
ncbi:4Fe-4S dicluster domain-containing protein [Amycolatopsis acidicola]|uniref:Glycolate oxidase iron-sulfur subunit n=1 Tax=Amycolatopsis acidicola TaxID=2596893 RepID=A0A5N0UPZ5_9PSEU|nr:heterodisulfide reductase-related iron-sulfur binding cluster [Amycolatopsis acidicola]KAA9150415.1 4Fe-4S dicluster domain-containing protein [Amycolatopsis acidicola]